MRTPFAQYKNHFSVQNAGLVSAASGYRQINVGVLGRARGADMQCGLKTACRRSQNEGKYSQKSIGFHNTQKG